MGGEPGSGPGPEPDRGGGGLVGQVLGVGQPGEPVDGGVQVHVPGAGAGGLGPVGGAVLGAVAAMQDRQPPPSGIRPTFLTSRWTMWPAVSGHDLPGRAQRFAVDVELAAPVQPEPDQPTADRRHRHAVALLGELDAISRADHLWVRRSRSISATTRGSSCRRVAPRGRRPVHQASLAVAAVPAHPLRQALPRHPRLGRHMRDRTTLAPLDQPQPAGRSQRGITVGHEAGLLAAGRVGRTSHPPPGTCLSHLSPAVTNLMSRNS